MSVMVANENLAGGTQSFEDGWREFAACRGMGAAVFFEELSPRALVRCAGCGVQEICFWYALATEEEVGYRFGIWAGTTPVVRARIAKVIGPGHARLRLATAVVAGVGPAWAVV